MQTDYITEPILWLIAAILFLQIGIYFFNKNRKSEKEARAFFSGAIIHYGTPFIVILSEIFCGLALKKLFDVKLEKSSSYVRIQGENEETRKLKEEIVKLKYVIIILLTLLIVCLLTLTYIMLGQ
jgi:hypothetical protein